MNVSKVYNPFIPLNLILVLILNGCATSYTGLVFPREDGTYEIISRSYTEHGAYSRAVKQARRTCQEIGATYVVLDRSFTYHGILTQEANKMARALENSVEAVTAANMPSASSSDDYKATLVIRCHPLPVKV